MRYYNLDGTYREEPNDTKFGWFCQDIVIDEAQPNYGERNAEIIKLEKMRKNLKREPSTDSDTSDCELERPAEAPIVIHECTTYECTFSQNEDCSIGVQGNGIVNNFPNFETIDTAIPSKEQLMQLINPCNAESKMLLAVISFSKYKSLRSDELFRTKSINKKTTNFKLYLNDEPPKNEQNELYRDIENYHASKEDNMMSLMMELVLNDINCNISDVTEKYELNTSDLGNSIQSNSSSKEYLNKSSSMEEVKFDDGPTHYFTTKGNYLQVPNRSDILSSLGLSEEDKSLQSFTEETRDMYEHLRDVRMCFKSEMSRVTDIMEQACTMEKNLRETIYLDNLLHLLNGHLNKVKLKDSAFKILIDPKKINDELNLIV